MDENASNLLNDAVILWESYYSSVCASKKSKTLLLSLTQSLSLDENLHAKNAKAHLSSYHVPLDFVTSPSRIV